MTHYYIKPKNAPSPVKILCNGVWVLKPSGHLKLASIDCPDCLKLMIDMEEKRLKILRENLLKATELPNVQ